MSTMSQFFSSSGGGGTPVGGVVSIVPGSKILVTSGTQEYLLSGNVVTYNSSYASAMSEAPALRVFGNASMEIGTKTASSGTPYDIYYVGTNYVYIPPSGSGAPQYYTTFPTTSTSATWSILPGNPRTVITNGTYLVYTASANQAPQVTSNGTSYTSVGGTFTTFTQKTAGAFGNNIWVTLSSMNGTAGEQGYIVAANPGGSWTVGTATNISMTATRAIAYGNGVFVAVGQSSSATAGKIATCTSPASGWTDRTSASGISFAAGDNITFVVFSGTHFVAVWYSSSTGLVRTIRSTDGITWTEVSNVSPIYQTLLSVATNGAGKIVVTFVGSSTALPLPIILSEDNGATWGGGQLWLGNIPVATSPGTFGPLMSYANSKFLENHSGTMTSIRDFGSFSTTPDYVGYQSSGTSYYRIK